jgi:hypothetical protein
MYVPSVVPDVDPLLQLAILLGDDDKLDGEGELALVKFAMLFKEARVPRLT